MVGVGDAGEESEDGAPADVYYRKALEESQVGVYVIQSGEYVYVNDRMAATFGYSPAKLCDGMSPFDLVAEADHEKLSERLEQRQAETASSEPSVLECRRADGERVYVEARACRIEYGGEPAIMGFVVDVTDRIEQESALQAERDRLWALFENAHDPTTDVTFTGGEARIEAVNSAFEDVFGYDAEEVEGKIVTETIVPGDELAGHRDIVERVRAGERIERTVRRETADGVRDFLVRLAPYQTETRSGTFATLIDITERRERERELEQYREMADTAPDMLYVLDTEGRFEFVNAAAADLTGYEPEELIGEHVSVFMNEDDIEAGRALNRRLLESDDCRPSDAFEWTLRRKDGETVPVESNVTLFRSDDEWQGTVGVIRDVSEQKAYRQELERQNERLDDFASVVSHDLRSPLNTAQGYLKLAREAGDDGHFDRATDALDRMAEIIDDVLAMARGGEAVTETAPVPLGDVTHSAWSVCSTSGSELVVADDLPLVAADEQRLQRLLENLFRNAVEHGSTSPDSHARQDAVEHGSTSPPSQAPEDAVEHGDAAPVVTVGTIDESGRSGFYVADDGPGIPPEERERIFDPGVSRGEGTGLGLRIVREIVDAHGWAIDVTDSADGGARFEITGVEFTSS